MKEHLLLIAALLFAQVAAAAETKFVDDAPKGFIHVTGESYGVETQEYLRANTVVRLQQFSEENDGKIRHYIRLHTTGTIGSLGGSAGDGKGEIRPPMFQIEFASKEEANKVRNRLLEILSTKE